MLLEFDDDDVEEDEVPFDSWFMLGDVSVIVVVVIGIDEVST